MLENEERRSTNKISPLKHDFGIYLVRQQEGRVKSSIFLFKSVS